MYITFNAEIHPPLVSEVNIGKRVKVGKDHYSQELLEIIDNCLDLDYLKRPQSVFSLQKSLMETPHKPQPKTGLVHKIFNVLNKHHSPSKNKKSL